MPRYTDPSTGKSFSSDEPLTDSELEEAFGGGESPLSKAGAYLLKRGKGFVGALNRLTGLPGQPSPTVGGVASDVAEVGGTALALSAGPVAGPAIVGGGLAAGAAGAAAGMKNPELAEAGANLLGGAISGGVNVYRGIKSARSLGSLGEDAKDIVPAASNAAREAFQARTYGKIGEAAAERGLRVRPFSEGGEALRAQLTAALEKWPAGSLERNEAQALLTKLAPAVPQGVRGANAAVLGGPTYAELDAAARNLAGIRHASGVRKAIGVAKNQLLEGTPLAAAKRAADVQWGKIIQPVKTIGLQVQKAKYHPDAIKAAVYGWRKLTPAQRAVLDPNGAVAGLVAKAEPGMPMGLAGRIVGGGSAAALIGASANKMYNGDFEGGFKTLLFGLPGAALAAAPATAGMVGTRFAAGVGRGAAGAAGALAPTLREPQTSPEPLGERSGRQEANGFNPQFGNGLHAMLADARRQGHQIGIASGVRSTARQAELYANAQRKYGANARHWVAPPGKSAHNLGIGADLSFGSPEAKAWAHANADKYGVQFRLGNEPWHAEIAGYDPTGQRKQAAPARGGAWDRELAAAAQVVGIPYQLLRIGMRQESSGRPGVTSEAGAHGLMQLMPATFEGLRAQVERINGREPGTASIRDPLDNIVAGALYWREALDKTDGDVQAASQYYFGGPTLRGPKSARYAGDITSGLISSPTPSPTVRGEDLSRMSDAEWARTMGYPG